MSDDRPPHVLEAEIRAARARGDFDDLPGRGKPATLDDLDHLPKEQRFEALLMRTTGEVSVQLSLVRDIRGCRKAIESSNSEPERERLRAILREKIAELQAFLQRSRAVAERSPERE